MNADPHGVVMGRISFGPGLGSRKDYRLTSDELPDVVIPSRTIEPNQGDMKPLDVHILDMKPAAMVLLIECFTLGGISRGMYWAGKSNRVERRNGGFEITLNVYNARRMTPDCREIAEELCIVMNEHNALHGNHDRWRVTEHFFG